jgi:hypothetical protein
MVRAKTKNTTESGNGSMLGFEATLCATADVDGSQLRKILVGGMRALATMVKATRNRYRSETASKVA